VGRGLGQRIQVLAVDSAPVSYRHTIGSNRSNSTVARLPGPTVGNLPGRLEEASEPKDRVLGG